MDKFQNKNKDVLKTAGEFGELSRPSFTGFGHPSKSLQDKLAKASNNDVNQIPLAEKKAKV